MRRASIGRKLREEFVPCEIRQVSSVESSRDRDDRDIIGAVTSEPRTTALSGDGAAEDVSTHWPLLSKKLLKHRLHPVKIGLGLHGASRTDTTNGVPGF